MQDPAYVYNKADELRELGGSNALNMTLVSNLEKQLSLLGLDTSMLESDSVSKILSMRRPKAVSDVVRMPSAAPASLVDFDRLRSPHEWGIDADEVVGKKIMCTFSYEPIAKSLTQLPDDLNHDAVLVFQDVLRRMGDMP